jgi:uncharacterized membrane protein
MKHSLQIVNGMVRSRGVAFFAAQIAIGLVIIAAMFVIIAVTCGPAVVQPDPEILRYDGKFDLF